MQEQGRRCPAKIESAEQRKERLAAELRANLYRRKARARAATSGEASTGVESEDDHQDGSSGN